MICPTLSVSPPLANTINAVIHATSYLCFIHDFKIDSRQPMVLDNTHSKVIQIGLK